MKQTAVKPDGSNHAWALSPAPTDNADSTVTDWPFDPFEPDIHVDPSWTRWRFHQMHNPRTAIAGTPGVVRPVTVGMGGMIMGFSPTAGLFPGLPPNLQSRYTHSGSTLHLQYPGLWDDSIESEVDRVFLALSKEYQTEMVRDILLVSSRAGASLPRFGKRDADMTIDFVFPSRVVSLLVDDEYCYLSMISPTSEVKATFSRVVDGGVTGALRFLKALLLNEDVDG
jgi:hypothetical protein